MFPSITVVPIEHAFSRNTGLGTNSLRTVHKNIVFVNNFLQQVLAGYKILRTYILSNVQWEHAS